MNTHTYDIRLSAQRALIGNLPASLIALSAEVRGEEVWLRSIFDSSATTDDREQLSIIGAEVIADFPNHVLHEEFQEQSVNHSMVHLSELIFLRGSSANSIT